MANDRNQTKRPEAASELAGKGSVTTSDQAEKSAEQLANTSPEFIEAAEQMLHSPDLVDIIRRDARTLGITGEETISITGLEGDLKPLSEVPATITYADGTVKEIMLKCRIDTQIDIEYVENGGVLHYVLRNLAKG